MAITKFLHAAKSPKPQTHIALLEDIVIPPASEYLVEVYVANIDKMEVQKEDEDGKRLIAIQLIQKMDDQFDPGFIMKNAVCDASFEALRVFLLNPYDKLLRISKDHQ
jgi:hypothetical protein